MHVCARGLRFCVRPAALPALALAAMVVLAGCGGGSGSGGGGSSTISTVAGSPSVGFGGDGGPGANALLSVPTGLALDGSGNLYIADTGNNRIRKVTASSGVISTVAGNGIPIFAGDGGPATSASLNGPRAVAVDGSGNLYIADTLNDRVRKVTAAGVISTLAGTGVAGFGGDNGPATSALFSAPYGVAVDGSGNVYIADRFNNRIRKVSATTGVITTVAGNGTPGFGGDGGLAISAQLNQPPTVTVDGSGNLYIADASNGRIRKVDASGNISTVAGNGTQGFAGDGGAATSAQFNTPMSAVSDGSNIYVADSLNNRVRKIANSISTVAGNGTAGFNGDGSGAASAELFNPQSVAVNSSGLYIADTGNNRVRKVSF